MPIITYGGKPLLANGKLTTDPDCCCLDPPIECPRCCISVDWGSFNADGDLVAIYISGDYNVNVKVVMPTKNSRVVCDKESVTVEMDVVGTPDPGDNNAWVQFGAAWTSTSNTPSVSAVDGKVFDRGLIEWGSIEDRTYSTTLKLDKCWLDTADMLAYIFIGMDNPTFSDEISVSRCLTTDFCCDDELVCDPCCFQYASVDTGWVRNSDFTFCRVVSNDHYTLMTCVETGTPGFVCLPSNGIKVDVSVIPHRYDPEKKVRVVMDWELWDYGGHSPAVAADGAVNGVPGGSVNWGYLAEYDYVLTLQGGCGLCQHATFGSVQINFFGPDDNRLVEDITFTACPDQTNCCCPTYCACGCYWPLSEGFCDSALSEPFFGLYEEGGPTQLRDLKIVLSATSSVFCGGTKSTVIIEQAFDSSRHGGICNTVGDLSCPESNGLFVEIYDERFHCGDKTGPDGWINVSLNESNDCEPNIQIRYLGGNTTPWPTEAIPIETGGLEGCTDISATGSAVIDGVTYSWEITGTVIGGLTCPCPEGD